MGGKLSKILKGRKLKKKIKKDLKKKNYKAARRQAFHLELLTDSSDSELYDYSDDDDDEEIYRKSEKCYDRGDSTLIFIEGEDDLDCVSSGLPERCTRKEPDSYDEEGSSYDEEGSSYDEEGSSYDEESSSYDEESSSDDEESSSDDEESSSDDEESSSDDEESSSDDEESSSDDEESSSDDEERSSEDVETSSDDVESYLDSEKCYNQHDPVLTFVNGDDDLDFECHDWRSPRARMSCGHAVTPMSLTLWCRRLLDEGKSEFVCGQAKCDVGWPFEEVCKMALLTPEEIEYFEKKMFCNAKELLEVKGCPSCKSLVMRKEPNNLNVECSVCTATKKRVYRFCWQCLREWKGPAPRQDRCENHGCQSSLEILMTCPEIIFDDVKGVKGCPTIRACPTCGSLIEHKGTLCKTIVCGRCRVKFCFVCLGFTDQCLKEKPYGACPSGVAPRQTSIPVWRKNYFYL